MVELISGLKESVVRANLMRVRQQLGAAHERARAAGTDGGRGEPQVLAATKYVALADMPVLAAAGVTLVGENRAQDLQEKVHAHGDLFEWHFIGQLQSRKVKAIVPHVSMIHSVASESALRELERHRERAMPGLRILIEVNLAGEAEKAGIEPDDLDAFDRALARPGGGADDDAADVAGARGEPPVVQRAAVTRRSQGSRAPLDGHLPGLSRRCRGGSEHRSHRHRPVPGVRAAPARRDEGGHSRRMVSWSE